jgi:hypothetical protein
MSAFIVSKAHIDLLADLDERNHYNRTQEAK